jgi:hypothetical protein
LNELTTKVPPKSTILSPSPKLAIFMFSSTFLFFHFWLPSAPFLAAVHKLGKITQNGEGGGLAPQRKVNCLLADRLAGFCPNFGDKIAFLFEGTKLAFGGGQKVKSLNRKVVTA